MVSRVASTSLVSNSPLRCSAHSCSSCCGESAAGSPACSVMVCSFRVAPDPPDILDVSARACYNFIHNYKGGMYGRQTKDVHVVRYTRGRDQLNLPHLCREREARSHGSAGHRETTGRE